tara:strand:+ start:744 stop:992 length:249 start_codon:yes stop_codon:yes gene_type:complete
MTKKVSLTPVQKKELIEQYAELLVDNMDTKTLAQYVYDDLVFTYGEFTSTELKENINDYDPELFDELLDNVTEPSVTLNVIK